MSMPASPKMRSTAAMPSQSIRLSPCTTWYHRVRPCLTISTRHAPSGVAHAPSIVMAGTVRAVERFVQAFYRGGMAAELVEHWFNRRWRVGRRDVYLTRDDSGWHVKARRGGWDGVEVVHDFTSEADAQAMLLRALETAPPG